MYFLNPTQTTTAVKLIRYISQNSGNSEMKITRWMGRIHYGDESLFVRVLRPPVSFRAHSLRMYDPPE